MGRLLKQRAQHDAAAICRCGHGVEEHRTKPYAAPSYDPVKFPCHHERCGCTDYERSKA